MFETLDLGGAERQGLLFARYLQNERKADVRVVGFRNPGRAAELCDQYGIPWSTVPSFRWQRRSTYPMALVRVLKELRSVRPEVLLPYTILPDVICGLTWRLAGAKACLWNQRDEGVHRVIRSAERFAVKNTRWFITNSEGGGRFLIDDLGVDASRLHLIGNGVELAPPVSDRKTWRAKLAIPDDALMGCMVANLHSKKDHPTLLRAWRTVNDHPSRREHPAVLLLAGRPSGTEDSLHLLADELGISDSVRFLGAVDDISGLLAASDIGVFSSVTEGCPNGVLEPMAVGLPVVATDIPSIRHAVGPDGSEWLAPVDDANGMAERICRLAQSRSERIALGALLRTRVLNEFTPQIMCERTADVIVQALTEGRHCR